MTQARLRVSPWLEFGRGGAECPADPPPSLLSSPSAPLSSPFLWSARPSAQNQLTFQCGLRPYRTEATRHCSAFHMDYQTKTPLALAFHQRAWEEHDTKRQDGGTEAGTEGVAEERRKGLLPPDMPTVSTLIDGTQLSVRAAHDLKELWGMKPQGMIGKAFNFVCLESQ